MNIVIIIIGVIDTIMIHVLSIITKDIISQVLIDILGTIFFIILCNHLLDDNEKRWIQFKWILIFLLCISLIGMLWAILKKQFIWVQTNFAPFISLFFSYVILLLHHKIGNDYEK